VTLAHDWKRLALICVTAGTLLALPAQAAAGRQAAPDNTKVNTRDREKTQKTADQQTNNPADLDTTQQIRKAILADKSLSTNAHNIKIITSDGMVTLKGPVKNEAEKKAIETKAIEVAGRAKVKSQISVTESPAPHPKTSPKNDTESKPKGK
jgi:hyperosmotically inducible protein